MHGSCASEGPPLMFHQRGNTCNGLQNALMRAHCTSFESNQLQGIPVTDAKKLDHSLAQDSSAMATETYIYSIDLYGIDYVDQVLVATATSHDNSVNLSQLKIH